MGSKNLDTIPIDGTVVAYETKYGSMVLFMLASPPNCMLHSYMVFMYGTYGLDPSFFLNI